MWRVVTERIATLTEVETSWSLADLYDANDALDAIADAQRAESERQAAKSRARGG